MVHNINATSAPLPDEVLEHLDVSCPLLPGEGGKMSRPRDKPHSIRTNITNDPNAVARVS